ncbi:unnamed protein product [Closterium sp. NIES-65]|nr:unnamed protein product [Closterium sp. NIES-65]
MAGLVVWRASPYLPLSPIFSFLSFHHRAIPPLPLSQLSMHHIRPEHGHGCCPCITFGQNMAMAGFGSCAPQVRRVPQVSSSRFAFESTQKLCPPGRQVFQALIYCALTWGACSCAQLTALCSTPQVSIPSFPRTPGKRALIYCALTWGACSSAQLIALCSTLDFALIYCALTWGACSCAQLIALCSTLDFFSSLGILLYCLGTSYPARFRTQSRRRFNIQLIALCSTLDFFSSLGILLYCLGTSYPARFRTQTRR